jgi:hypothetical protein
MNKNKPEFVVIETVQGQMTAEVIKSHLESEGIPVFLQCESIGRVWGVVIDVLGGVKILVPKEFAEEAKKIITVIYIGDTNRDGSTGDMVTETIVDGPTIVTTSLPNSVRNNSYSQTISITGGLAPFTWSITGSLPPGLSMNISGIIIGKPTARGTFSFTVKVIDSLGNTATQSLSIKVN